MTDLVALRLPTAHALAAALDDVWAGGDAALPVPARLAEPAVASLLEMARPARLVTETATIERDDSRPVPEATALVVATSGSTGAPKGVALTHAALDASAAASLAALDCPADARWLCCLPLDHVAGIQVLRRARLLGTDALIQDGFDVAAIARAAFTHVSLVPTQLARALAAGVDLTGRTVLLGGAPAPRELLERAGEAGIQVVTSYGMTETCGGCVYDGTPLDGVEVRLRDDGRILLRGPVLMSGYLHDPGRTSAALDADGWFITADVGRFDDDGRLHVVGRADDVIITGGENVSAGVVAAVVASHPAVDAAVVLARPDVDWGQRVVVVVTLRRGATELDLDEVRDHVGERLGRHAAPRELHVLTRLPRTGLGKPDLAALRHRLGIPQPPP